MIRTFIKKTALVVSALAVAVSGSIAGVAIGLAPAAKAEACIVDEKLVNSCRPWLGAAANGYPNIAGTGAEILGHEQRIGRELDIVHLYTPPGDMQLTDESVMFATRPNTILSVTWQPASRWADASGTNATTNANIDRMADSINALGDHKIMLTLHHEPENDVSGGGQGCAADKNWVGNAGTPAEYRQMWQTTRDRFDAKGVDNVVWVMNYMGYSGWDCIVDDLYPGNHLVDWIKWDPYGEKVDFENLVGRFYDWLAANSDAEHDYLSKPWGLAEWGSWHNATQDHAYLLYQSGKAAIESNRFPRLKAYSIFDVFGTCRIAYDRDGNYDATEVALYKEFAQSPVFVDPAAPSEPDTQAPTVPTNLTAVTSGTSATLNWDASTDDNSVANYVIYRDGIVINSSNTTSYTDNGLVQGASYTYTVSARDAAGNESAQSTPFSVLVPTNPGPDTTPPTTPSSFTATPGSRRIVLNWSAATDNVGVAGYYLVRDGVRIATLSPNTLTFTDTGLTSGKRYWYQVRAFDAAGNKGATAKTDARAN